MSPRPPPPVPGAARPAWGATAQAAGALPLTLEGTFTSRFRQTQRTSERFTSTPETKQHFNTIAIGAEGDLFKHLASPLAFLYNYCRSLSLQARNI